MVIRGDDVTISSVAGEALVSRRTIYAHWGSIENLVADSIFDDSESAERDIFLTAYRDPLRLLPAMVRELAELRTRHKKPPLRTPS